MKLKTFARRAAAVGAVLAGEDGIFKGKTGFAVLSFLPSNLREWGRFLRESLCLSPDGYVII